MRVENLTPVVVAAPGDRATCHLRIENDQPWPMGYRLRVVGFDDGTVVQPPPNGPLAAGGSEDVEIGLVIPEAFAAGHHSVAVEVVPDRTGVPPAIAAITVTVGQIDDVALAVVPSTIRAHRRATFRLDIDNRSDRLIDLELDAEGPDVSVRMRPDRVLLRPGERVRTSGRVKGPRHLVGEPLQHALTVRARSSSAPSYAPATFQQRPLLPRGLRSLVAVLLIVGIWAGALGAGFLWWNTRDDGQADDETVELVDIDGDGINETPANQLVDTNGDGVADTLAAVVAEQRAAAGDAPTPPQAGGGDRPTRTVMSGTVSAEDGGDPSGVGVTLTPLELGASPPEGAAGAPAALTGAAAGASRSVGKLWPSRFGRYQPAAISAVRQTETVLSTATGADGAWLFPDVAVGQPYEVSFSLPGFDTQSFVVTPSADGKPVQMEVELKAAEGSIGGVVVGSRGPLGNVDLVLTDGTLRFESSSSSGANTGAFSFSGVSTPGTYTLSADIRGYGTEVLQLTLEPGEQLDGVRIGMTPGVGSISGRVTEGSEPLGGVRLTASNGDVTAETTSLTEGATGTYTFPQLTIPGTYTVTASLDGYETQTRLVRLTGNQPGVDFQFVKTTGAITGIVASSTGPALPGANIRVSRDDLAFDSRSAVSPDPGSFAITDLPPGTYLVEFSRYDHAPFSQTVEVAAGQTVDLGRIVLEFRPRPDITQNGSLEVRVVDSNAVPLTGATVRLVDVSDESVVAEQTDSAGTQSSFVFEPLPIGTYRVEVDKGSNYRRSERRVSVGLGRRVEVIPLYKLGQASGRMVDSFDTTVQLTDYDIQIMRINPDGSEAPVFSVPVPPGKAPDSEGNILWETPVESLTSGQYRVTVAKPPPGYRVIEDQILQAGQPAMQFAISPTDDDPIRLNDILADRLPEVEGAVSVPQLNPPPDPVTFVAIDSPELAVTLTCPGENGVSNTIPAELRDMVPGPNPDFFYFAPVRLQLADMSGNCELTVSAGAAYTPITIPVSVEAQRGARGRVVRNIALVRPEDVSGLTYWLDEGVAPAVVVPAVGVGVRTQGPVIVGFDPGTGPPPPAGDPPVERRSTVDLTGTTDVTGRWAFIDPKQVFGATNYVFELPGQFQTRTISLTLSETSRAVASVPPGSPLALADGPDGVAVQLDANGGPIDATVQIRTIKGTARFPGTVADLDGFALQVSRVAPAPGVTFPQPAAGTSSVARVLTTDPGTYTAAITRPPNHTPFPGESQSDILLTQQPGQGVAFTRTYTELGSLQVEVVDRTTGGRVGGATIDVSSAGVPTLTGTTATAAPNVFDGLPVDPNDPVGLARQYQIGLRALAGYDMTTVSAVVTTETGGASGCVPGTLCNAAVFAGGRPVVRFSVEPYGRVVGAALGNVGGPAPEALTLADRLVVRAQRVLDLNCNFVVPEAPLAAVPTPGSPDFFTVSGPPGYYTITVSHPDFGPPTTVPSTDVCPNGLSPFIQPAFRIQNGTTNPRSVTLSSGSNRLAWTLPVTTAALVVDVRNDTVAGAPVAAATVVVTPADGDPITRSTLPTGTVRIEGLLPGAYEIAVRKTGPAGEILYFPVIFDVTIARGGAGVNAVVPFPQIGGGIDGAVGAVNSAGRPVPAPASVDVTRAYEAPDVVVNGTATPNTNDPGAPQTVAATPPTDPASGSPLTYQLRGLASGLHTITFSDETPAYAAPTAVEVDVIGFTPIPAERRNYVAADRVVTVSVTSVPAGEVVGAVVTLTSPSGQVFTVPLTATGVARFENVPPELTDFQLTVAKPLFTPVAQVVRVSPGTGVLDVPVTLRGSSAVVAGQVDLLQAVGSQGPLAGASAQLVRVSTGLPVGPPATTDASGAYRIPVSEPGQYVVRVTATNVASRDSAPFGVVLGQTTPVPTIVVPRLATVVVDVLGPPGGSISGQALPAGTAPPTPQLPARAGRTFTFTLDPDYDYRFAFTSSAGFAPVTVPATATGIDPGQRLTLPDASMPVRTVSGTVTGITASGATVRATTDGTTVFNQIEATPATGAFTLPGPGSGNDAGFPPATYTLVAARFGVGRGTATVPVAATTPVVTGVSIALGARPVNVTFTSVPTGSAIVVDGAAGGRYTGTGGGPAIAVPENQFPATWTATLAGNVAQSGTVTFTDPGSTSWQSTSFALTVDPITLPARTVTGTVSAASTVRAVREGTTTSVGAAVPATGAFSLSGPFPVGDYTVIAEQLGTGRATAAAAVPTEATGSVAVGTLTLQPRSVNLQFSSLPTGASISVTPNGSATPITGTAGGAPIPVPENGFPAAWSASLAGHDTVTGSVPLAVSETAPSWTLTAFSQTVATITLPVTPTVAPSSSAAPSSSTGGAPAGGQPAGLVAPASSGRRSDAPPTGTTTTTRPR